MKELQKSLLERFKGVRDSVAGMPNTQIRKETLITAALEVCTHYDGIIAVNYKELLEHQLSLFGYDIDALISYLKEELQNTFDLETTRRELEDDFDRKYGSQTSAVIEQMELPEMVSLDRLRYAARYHPSPVKIVQKALGDLANYNVRYNDWTFIDIGSGLGRNLLLASRYGFGRIVGIEISAYLCELALENIKKYNAIERVPCKAVICCQDILDYQFPGGNMVLYCWEPFQGRIQEEFVKKLEHHVLVSPFQVMIIFLGTPFPGISRSSLFRQVGRHLDASERTIGLGITYFQSVSTPRNERG